MATYIVLANFTDKGLQTVKDSTKRAESVKEMAKSFGVEMKSIYWTLGQHDMVVTFEAPNDAAMTSLGLTIAAAGNVRSQTLRAFSKDEMSGILGKVIKA